GRGRPATDRGRRRRRLARRGGVEETLCGRLDGSPLLARALGGGGGSTHL
ncbi:MAG: hypothetical protein AVDCRST_MAG06-1301, partial [uncultured Nocardioides sp.]